ncbi:hypothetical protein [Halogeometricum luteum]|uniref:TFIIB-type zinc ribbon-containing protein n=1 Tax=Halogeometricum luteum TaxID=2950537 RepID=A0ABU2G6J5_9EURY|nr:hypothetical protein [Halogeometricum sp. S3BR5-2]MDS0296416.1 TFIIB-type zinc ribbon-containing protein [Halogeometricum sp. S3BR5-2]
MTDCPNCGETLTDPDPHSADGADYVCENCGRKWQDGIGDELQRVFEKPTDERR